MSKETKLSAKASMQGDLWGRHPELWAKHIEPQERRWFEATMDALEPLADVPLVDVGCGSGLALTIAAEKGATIFGLDASEGLLDVARDRLPDADLRIGEIEALPFDSETFDRVSSFNVIQYADAPGVAVGELARVCRPGGKVALGIWGDPAKCETEALFARLRSLAPPPPGTAAPLAVSEPGVVEDLLQNAGLKPTGGDEVPFPIRFADLDEAWIAHSSAGPLQKLIEMVGTDKVRAVVEDVLEADRKPDNELRQDNVLRYVIATKGT
jgi:SAM-dependent methyltransferase